MNMYPEDPFPWRAVLGCAVIIAVIIGVALTTGTCTTDMPC